MKQQRGMALLVVLLLLAVMVTMATSMTERFHLEWQRTYQQQLQQQNYWYLLGSETLVAKVINQDLEDSPEKNSLAQYWASEGQIFPVEAATLQGVIRDAQACFNLNALTTTNTTNEEEETSTSDQYRANVFTQLLISLKVDDYRAQQITAAIQDWLDTNSTARSLGAEDGEYEGLSHPYLPANGLMQDVSELRAVQGVDAALYRQLLPYVCVIPEKTLQINVNTLRTTQAPLLAALLLNNLSVDDARTILEQRPREGWNSVSEFMAEQALNNISIDDQFNSALTVKSFYFLATLQAETDKNQTRIVSLFQRQSNNQVIVIRRHFGGLE